MTTSDRQGRARHLLIFAGIVLPPLLILTVLLPGVPLGEPDVWTWKRFGPFFDFVLWLELAVCFAAGAFAAWRLDVGGGGRRRLAAAVLIVSGLLADCAILNSGRLGLAENALAILNPFTTGYLRPAGATPRDFVKDELTVPPGEVPHHRHVHPPGNVWLAKTVCRLPGSWGGRLLPETGRELEELRKQDGLIAPLDTPEMIEAALKLTVLLVLALALGKLVLARMLWRMPGVRARGTAVLTVLFGSNAAVLFLGHYDTFYFLLAALVLWSVMLAVRQPVRAFFSGFLTGIGGLFTLGFGAVGGLAAAMSGQGALRWKRLAYFAAGGLAVAAVCMASGVDLWRIFLKCWENQRLFQAMSGRGYGIWCLLNVLDALLFCGVLPCLALLLPPERGRFFRNAWRWALIFWLFILFSGGARGEFGRLAIVYLPVLLLALGLHFGRTCPPRETAWRIAAVGLMLIQTAFLRNALKLVLIDG